MKRLLAFLLLLAVGGVALWLAIGDEAAVKANANAQREPERPRAPSGVPIQQGKTGIVVSPGGQVSFPQYRTVLLPDGSARNERVFELHAEDSAPLTDTLQQFDRVTVLLFENDRETARLRANRAFLELRRDAAGKPALRDDKEIDLRDVVFETLPGARLEGLRLELGNARIQIGEEELHLRTANETDPVLLTVDGARSGTLRGNGLQARLPRSRASALRRTDIVVLHDPVLESAGIVVRAKGRMVYREDMDRGAAIVTLDDEVQLELRRGQMPVAGLGGTATPHDRLTSTIRGDRFTGWLRRTPGAGVGGSDSQDTGWDKLQLTGAPASVELDMGRLLTPRITVLPGMTGEPWLVTAHGGESRIEQTRLVAGSKQEELVAGTSPRRIHLVRTGSGTGAVLRSFGFPQWTLRPLVEQQVVVFEGASRLESGNRTVTASRGLHVFHRENSDHASLRGFGDVRIAQRATKPREQDLIAIGNDGFLLHATEAAQDLRLGPAMPTDPNEAGAAWRNHRYELQHGAARATGVGACSLTSEGPRTRLWLRAPGTEIEGRLVDQQLELDSMRQFEVVLDGERLVSLEAAGLPARARSTGSLQQVAAVAPRFVQIGERSLRLEGVPADAPPGLWPPLSEYHALPILTRTFVGGADKPSGRVEVRGPCIDVHHEGGDDVLVDAIEVDGVRPTVNLSVQKTPGAEPTTAFFTAQRLRALPFVTTPEAQLAHAGGSRSTLTRLLHATVAQPWLLVDDVRDFQLEDPEQGLVEGNGTRLLLSQGAQAGLFVGDPDLGLPAEVRRSHLGREWTARGARVRLFREQDLRLQALRTFDDRATFLLPSVTLHEAGSTGPLSHVIAVCQSHIDVLTDRVDFGGPVRVTGLTADGDIDPDGILLDAEQLVLRRDPTSGRIAKALANNVRLDWPRLKAIAAEVELDVARTRCIVRDPDEATVVMPGAGTMTTPFFELNYETMSFRSTGGRLDRSKDVGATRR